MFRTTEREDREVRGHRDDQTLPKLSRSQASYMTCSISHYCITSVLHLMLVRFGAKWYVKETMSV